MGISHPLSDEFYGGPRGGGLGLGSALLLSPDRTPPPPPASCCSPVDGGQEDFLQHEVSRMDTLAGIAIKYGVQISDIKRANSLVTDSQMYAHKALLIPLPGRPMPSSVKLNGSSLRSKRAWAPNNQQNRDIVDSLDSVNSRLQQSSLAMSSLQSYYGLSSQRGDDMDLSTEMSLYSKGSSQVTGSEILPISSSPPDSTQSTGRSNGAAKEKQDGSIRRRQKVEADTNDDLLSDSIKSAVRRSPSAPSFADSENGGAGGSMWSSSKWTFNHESFTRPLLDGLPKPSPGRRMKAALD
ncbi:unnamed protein product [Triticum turgidum subsp. durum]|uniref:LysM domain-containing protein n=1 Tax=Triticum turgidum subsp. durum TaxID=4567 RepID=A0A9R1AFJ6_TRITD|nr:unnamed protein product [Triticum turgidum subsp. durum]